MKEALRRLGPFDSVLDVGGNVGQFAELSRELWPTAMLTSFEPIPALAAANEARARGRWVVEAVALGRDPGTAELSACLNQPSASTMLIPGPARRQRFGISDRWSIIEVQVRTLDQYRERAPGRCLVKLDVEGFEGAAIWGGMELLSGLEPGSVVIAECNEPDVFAGAPSPGQIDRTLRELGLFFHSVIGCLVDPRGEVVQFDGVWQKLRVL